MTVAVVAVPGAAREKAWLRNSCSDSPPVSAEALPTT